MSEKQTLPQSLCEKTFFKKKREKNVALFFRGPSCKSGWAICEFEPCWMHRMNVSDEQVGFTSPNKINIC